MGHRHIRSGDLNVHSADSRASATPRSGSRNAFGRIAASTAPQYPKQGHWDGFAYRSDPQYLERKEAEYKSRSRDRKVFTKSDQSGRLHKSVKSRDRRVASGPQATIESIRADCNADPSSMYEFGVVEMASKMLSKRS